MSKRRPLSADRQQAPGLLLVLALLCLCVSAPASADTQEHARLAAALRQLDAIEHLVAEQPSADEHARYHFDYSRLRADLERVRTGIRDYLSPSRAQPRDSAQLLGDYRQSYGAATDTEAAP
ncbi:integrative conjugative element protein, RAQPRD family [Pseudomonas lopnurensis]|uniref:integrative conjugative element protein, RAQPRD family n=1 Tax=Pseudomonas lopnurensis TaxID=1477517 RepID=UPI0028B081CB|nr:RAQPRD family integrative conjugative element protein [Pseudomonas lopnurensis]